MKIRMLRQHLNYQPGEVYDISSEAGALWVANGLATLEEPSKDDEKLVAETVRQKNQKKPRP